MLALPIFPYSHPHSIVGEGVLNFCVRDGNRWTHTPINTNSSKQALYPSPRSESPRLTHAAVSPLKIITPGYDFVLER